MFASKEYFSFSDIGKDINSDVNKASDDVSSDVSKLGGSLSKDFGKNGVGGLGGLGGLGLNFPSTKKKEPVKSVPLKPLPLSPYTTTEVLPQPNNLAQLQLNQKINQQKNLDAEKYKLQQLQQLEIQKAEKKAAEKKAMEEAKKQRELQLKEDIKLLKLAEQSNKLYDIQKNKEFLLNKYNYYTTLQNNKLNGQLDDLSNIESVISTRDTLVQGNQAEYEKKETQIHVLKVFFVIVSYLAIVLILYLGGKISLTLLLTNITISLLIYLIYVAYVFNLFKTKSFVRYSEKEINKAQQEIYDVGRQIEDNLNNCECPRKHKSRGNDYKRIGRYTGPISDEIGSSGKDGFYYNNNGSVSERIYPPFEENDTTYEIQWMNGPMGMEKTDYV